MIKKVNLIKNNILKIIIKTPKKKEKLWNKLIFNSKNCY